jgi:oligopeptide/dipeptide ABC transporter ATP-binding protein
MYAGRLVEMAPIGEMITTPRHPYTRMLIDSLPSLDVRGTLHGIPGLAPLLRDLPSGCAFHPRCPMAVARCRTDKPAVRSVGSQGVSTLESGVASDGRADATVACHLA